MNILLRLNNTVFKDHFPLRPSTPTPKNSGPHFFMEKDTFVLIVHAYKYSILKFIFNWKTDLQWPDCTNYARKIIFATIPRTRTCSSWAEPARWVCLGALGRGDKTTLLLMDQLCCFGSPWARPHQPTHHHGSVEELKHFKNLTC